MAKITLNLISGRTISSREWRWRAERRKTSIAEPVGLLRWIDLTSRSSGVWKNTNVRVTSPYGSVIVKAIRRPPRGHTLGLV